MEPNFVPSNLIVLRQRLPYKTNQLKNGSFHGETFKFFNISDLYVDVSATEFGLAF